MGCTTELEAEIIEIAECVIRVERDAHEPMGHHSTARLAETCATRDESPSSREAGESNPSRLAQAHGSKGVPERTILTGKVSRLRSDPTFPDSFQAKKLSNSSESERVQLPSREDAGQNPWSVVVHRRVC